MRRSARSGSDARDAAAAPGRKSPRSFPRRGTGDGGMAELQELQEQIKVKVKRFSLRRGRLRIRFLTQGETVTALFLKKRNAIEEVRLPFTLKRAGDAYDASLDLEGREFEEAFWDVVASVEAGGRRYDAALGGVGAARKIKFILFPRWYRNGGGFIVYPFVNGARQFTIQTRKYQKEYDSWRFLCKEYLALLCYFLLKPYWDGKRIWLVCEKLGRMAQDNGFYFFKYCMEQLPEEEKKRIFYLIDKDAPDYRAVAPYEGNVLPFMSFRHMVYLCAAEYLISSDAIRHFYAWDSPNSVYKVLYQARKHIVFLQHGVMAFKQCHRMFRKSGGNRMALFIVSSEFERKIIHENFEYDWDEIAVTGLPRWDVLHDTSDPGRPEILLMPTWRGWMEYDTDEEFRESEYFRVYASLLNSRKLRDLLEERGITLNFYLHPKFAAHIGQFRAGCPRIRLIPSGERPLNELLMRCSMLVTDYSSVAWDVYYQEKPVVFFPFDLELYEEMQGSYIDMERDAFGDVVRTEEELISAIQKYAGNGFHEDARHAARRDYLLPLRDDKNSERIYRKILEAKPGKKLNLREKLFG